MKPDTGKQLSIFKPTLNRRLTWLNYRTPFLLDLEFCVLGYPKLIIIHFDNGRITENGKKCDTRDPSNSGLI